MISEEELFPTRSINFAPMVDFLFMIIAIFAVFILTRPMLYDAQVTLIDQSSGTGSPPSAPESQKIHLTITSTGQYKWQERFFHLAALQEELKAAVPSDSKPPILLYIDKMAQWQSIAKLIFTLRKMGFTVNPVYHEQLEDPSFQGAQS